MGSDRASRRARRRRASLCALALMALSAGGTASASEPSGEMSLSPTSVTFGGQIVGSTSSARVVTATDTADTPLTISGITVGGAHPGDFAIVSDGCSGATLAPGETCAISVTFKPTATGARSASVSFSTSAVSSPTLALAGTGTQPTLTPSVSSIDFGIGAAGQTSPARDVTITNTGSGVLGPISASIDGAYPGDFEIVANGCTLTYGAGQGCTMSLRGKPSADGLRTGALVLHSNDPVGPRTVALRITGDALAPVSTFTTQNEAVLVGTVNWFTGTVTDAGAGVAELVLTYQNIAGAPTFVKPALDCDVAHTACEWRAQSPVVPGVYRVNARSSDYVGNMETPGPEITVIVL